ncbi:hypothetical protein ASJ33_01805 [Dehalococcoides mccartyi]|jgi:PAS domain S-box-containing protein|uniref:PAS domain-containing sensor histidine kinase n=1 Tax=Dehalococcoides mccartyi TaxID=61435 RepID=UPI0004E04E3B|nr:ATP-binding protein [Dehalococcoides mccartyi]AII57477.1 ATPase [Dehalococcoides mccartyi CG1]APH11974.1 hypothetical protein ASJ33_01805 [Dehalococcoides mccartyi]
MDISGENYILKKHIAKLNGENRFLRKQYKKYFTLFNQTTDAVILFKVTSINAPVIISEVNEATCRHLGYNRQSLLGKSSSLIDTPETTPKVREILESLETNGQKITRELSITTKKGTLILVETNSQLIRVCGENYVIAVIRDITDRKRNEQLLVESYSREKCLRERLEFEIEQRIKFTRFLVHELKNPITLMISTAEVFCSQNFMDRKLSVCASSLLKGTYDLDRRIDELLDIAKGEIGILKLEYSSVNVKLLIKEITKLTSQLFVTNSQSFTVDCPNNLPDVYVDRERIKQVIINLLNNAAKYTPVRGRIELRIYQQKDQDQIIFISVEDNGLGMSQEELQDLFKLYASHDKHGRTGLGVGLALSKMIINLHHGEITVESKPGVGSKFTLFLPLSLTRI